MAEYEAFHLVAHSTIFAIVAALVSRGQLTRAASARIALYVVCGTLLIEGVEDSSLAVLTTATLLESLRDFAVNCGGAVFGWVLAWLLRRQLAP